MALSFTEKQHWKNRIEKIIEGKIVELKKQAANVINDIKAEAKTEIEKELNISNELVEYKKRAEEMTILEGMQRDLLKLLAAEVYAGELPYRVDVSDIERQIKSLVKERTDSQFSFHELGRHMDFLHAEKSRLLDEVLLAGNSQQITRLLDIADALEPLPLSAEEKFDNPISTEHPTLLLTDYSLQ